MMVSKFNKASNSCILFFNGWGMDEKVISRLEGDFDLIIYQDYSILDAEMEKSFSQYENLYVVGWSYGVAVGNYYLDKWNLKIEKAVAINGTPYIGHDDFGIPNAILKATMDNWSDAMHKKFNLRMHGGKSTMEENRWSNTSRSVEQLGAELSNLIDQMTVFTENDFRWDKAFIFGMDKIIPAKNQFNYWENKVQVVHENGAHFPFNNWENWDEIINDIG